MERPEVNAMSGNDGKFESLVWLKTLYMQTTSFKTLLDEIRSHLVDYPKATHVLQVLSYSWQLLTVEGSHTDGRLHLCQQLAEVVQEFSWERLHIGHWRDVSFSWRKLYSIASLLKAACLVRFSKFHEGLVEIDKGILLGANILDKSLHSFAKVLTSDIQNILSCGEGWCKLPPDKAGSTLCDNIQKVDTKSSLKIGKVTFRNYRPSLNTVLPITTHHKNNSKSILPSDTPLVDVRYRIPLLNCPTLETFYKEFMTTNTPIVLTGIMDHWPAYSAKKWK